MRTISESLKLQSEQVQAFALFISVAHNDNLHGDSGFGGYHNGAKNVFAVIIVYKPAQFRQGIELSTVAVTLLQLFYHSDHIRAGL